MMVPVVIAFMAMITTQPASGASLCIVNDTDQTLLLVVDDLATRRIAKIAVAGEQLCLPVADCQQKGTVGVFADAEALEGCSRLSRAGQVEHLLAYQDFDNCRWQDTPRGF